MNTPALSNIELFHQIRWLNGSLKDYYVNNVYWVTKGTILIRLHHSSNPEKRLVIKSGEAIWVTDKKIEGESVDSLLNIFRKKLNRGKIDSITQPGSERIAYIDFTGCESKRLVAEFFGNGNIILLDDEDIILAAIEYYVTRHRKITIGERYTLPPSRGIDPMKIDREALRPLLSYDGDFRKWIGKNISLPKKYIDTLPPLLNMPPGTIGKQLGEHGIEMLVKIFHGFFEEDPRALKPTVYLEGEAAVDFSLFPLDTVGFDKKEVDSINSAIDAVYTKSCLETREQLQLHQIHREKEGLKNTIESLERKKKQLDGDRRALADIAQRMKKDIGLYYQDRTRFEQTLYPAKTDDSSSEIVYKDFRFKFDQNNPLKTSSDIFNTSKAILQEISKLDSSMENLRRELEKVNRKMQAEERNMRREAGKAFEKEWFERYRWFYTSEGFLAVGGRDASSNEAIIKKHLEDDDLVFHAEFTGAPFFIMKNGKKATEQSIKEVALAAAAFSNLWKLGASTGESYWIHKDQVSKSAPSGQYMGKGAFMITGKRNYVKSLSLEIAIGIVKVKDHYSVVSGPEEALRKHVETYVLIVPGREEKTCVAKKIEAILVKRANLPDDFRMIPLDDFVRALPPGGCKIKT
ncbi:MAG: ribosome rescue protein RqcH [Nitrososphaeria archaeon]